MLRRLVSFLCYFSGLLSLMKWRRRNTVTILMLHSVLDTTRNRSWMPVRSYLDAERFRQGLIALDRWFNFVSISEAVGILDGSLPAVHNALVITFDDGYANNFEDALPILNEQEVPASFYVVTEKVRTQKPFWFDRIDYCAHVADEECRFNVGEQNYSIAPREVVEKSDLVGVMRDIMRREPDDHKLHESVEGPLLDLEANVGGSLMKALEEANDPCRIVSVDEMRNAAANDNVTIGSHTRTHTRLTGLTEQAVREELVESKCFLRELLGPDDLHFCYPNGEHTAAIAQMVKEAGYVSAVTTRHDTNYPNCDPFTLARMNWPHNASPQELIAITLGVYRG